MSRILHQCKAAQSSVKVEGNLGEWLSTQAVQYGSNYLLAHTDDGVIWGKFDLRGELSLSQTQQGALQQMTLQTLRLFGDHAEVMLWRVEDDRWEACVLCEVDKDPDFLQAFDENQMLWGTDATPLGDGFTQMSDGAQGLRHTVPLEVTGKYDEKHRPLRLQVRHYLKEDDFGVVYIAASRLVGLSEGSEKP
ncbi:hypothetical protein ANRL4_03453 [Anaerolineae bacterium]|nr:hypothetical protein ANRL4_03453 [Anaerolineae bacterium]